MNKGDKAMRKDLKKLVKSLLKEDRNNAELVAKFVEVEYELEGYESAYNILTTSLSAFNKSFLTLTSENEILSSLVLVRVGVEMELNEISAGQSESSRGRLHQSELRFSAQRQTSVVSDPGRVRRQFQIIFIRQETHHDCSGGPGLQELQRVDSREY